MIPILLLTGFLGSGKTTLLNRLLEQRPVEGPFAEKNGKLALIVNEFGDVGIDGDLLPDEMTRQIEIKGGCICCRLDGDLEKTLLELVASEPDITAIVIETTGIAEPLPVSWTLAKEELAEQMRLAAVITVADASMHLANQKLSPSTDAQVEYGDILLITKIDLATLEQVNETEEVLRQQNAFAPIVKGNVEGIIHQLWQMLDDPELGHDRSLTSASAPTVSHSFDSIFYEIQEILDYEELTEHLEGLPPSYVRVKGIAKMVDGRTGEQTPKMVAFHRVGARVSVEPAREGLSCRIVAIGTNLDLSLLVECVHSSKSKLRLE